MLTSTKLGDLGTWGSGGTPLATRRDYYGGEIPWLIIEDLNDGIVTRATKSITKSGLENSSAKIVPPGTLLVAMYGSIGKLGLTALSAATNQAIAFCKPDASKVDVDYLFFLLLSERQTLIGAGRGGTQQNISQEFLKEYEVFLPSLKEQTRIAQLLRQADRLRHMRRYALDLCDELVPSAFSEMFGKCAASKNCPVKPLEEVVDPDRFVTYGIVQAGPHVCGGIPYIKTGDIVDGVIRVNGLQRTSPDIAESYKRSQVKSGDLIISIRATVGTIAILPAELDGANLTQGTARIAPSQEIDKHFLLWQIRAPATQRWIKQQIKGTTFLEITLERLREMPVFVPPLTLQKKFSVLAQRHEHLHATNVEALRQADHLFQTLLHQAFGTK